MKIGDRNPDPPIHVALHVGRVTLRGYPSALRDDINTTLNRAIAPHAAALAASGCGGGHAIDHLRIEPQAGESLEQAISRAVRMAFGVEDDGPSSVQPRDEMQHE